MDCTQQALYFFQSFLSETPPCWYRAPRSRDFVRPSWSCPLNIPWLSNAKSWYFGETDNSYQNMLFCSFDRNALYVVTVGPKDSCFPTGTTSHSLGQYPGPSLFVIMMPRQASILRGKAAQCSNLYFNSRWTAQQSRLNCFAFSTPIFVLLESMANSFNDAHHFIIEKNVINNTVIRSAPSGTTGSLKGKP